MPCGLMLAVLTVLLGVMQTSAYQVLSEGAAGTITGGGVHCERSFAPDRLVEDLRRDIEACAEAGLFAAAGSGGRDAADDTMRSAEYCDPIARDRSIGLFDAFFALWERLDMVRQELEEAMGTQLLPEMEIHYVRYLGGGFYERHLDDYRDSSDRSSRRAVSFICYLNEPSEPWAASDGGMLRAWVDDAELEILPEAGSLVLFDSCVVEHEVATTHRERRCLIGWWHTPI